MYPNRYICAVLDEMRDCCKTLNFSYLLGLIEEAQHLANRMESKLSDISDFEALQTDRDELHKEIKSLRKEKCQLKNE